MNFDMEIHRIQRIPTSRIHHINVNLIAHFPDFFKELRDFLNENTPRVYIVSIIIRGSVFSIRVIVATVYNYTVIYL